VHRSDPAETSATASRLTVLTVLTVLGGSAARRLGQRICL
jgi:hypothetical protein